MLFKLAFKQTWRDARAGDVLLLGLAIVIAVAALSTVGLLADRVGRALERDAAQMLGADLNLAISLHGWGRTNQQSCRH